VSREVVTSVTLFVFVYVATVLVGGLALTACGLDVVTALSSSATALGNVGPGIGSIVGPAGNFSTLPDGAKWILSLIMLLGRLELMTVLIMFSRDFWQR